MASGPAVICGPRTPALWSESEELVHGELDMSTWKKDEKGVT